MSLTLREKAQPLLDQHGLVNYHVGISSQKQMQIHTECGQLVVGVKGVTFSRQDPTLKEIDYSIELLDAFLAKHIVLLKKMMVAKAKDQKMEEVKHAGFANARYGTNSRIQISYKVKKQGDIVFSEDGSVVINLSFDSLKEANAYKVPATLAKKAKEILDSKIAIRDSGKVIASIATELNKCAI